MVASARDTPTVAVVLAGGTGTRLYPASRPTQPKQVLPLAGSESLLSQTLSRAQAVADEVVVLTQPALVEVVAPLTDNARILTEPAARDTGPAIVYAAGDINNRHEEAVMLVFPSDHVVGEGFTTACNEAHRVAASTNRLVTFGIEPTRRETGYGYIAPDTQNARRDPMWYPIESFHEKPDAATAQSYIDAGYLWNAGMFAFRPTSLLSAAEDSSLHSLANAVLADDADMIERTYTATDAISVDHALFESASNTAVLPVSFDWDDIGAWDAFDRLNDDSNEGTTTVGQTSIETIDADKNIIASDGAHVSLIGVSDLVVVSWDNRVLVVPKERAQDVKQLVKQLDIE
jgi:mannose-1-phosphate guanylyltransferase (GDP) (EC 2.7.7.22)/mannose-6-phosphate isomerase, type 2 (EC 5.3.1.8)